MFFTAYRIIPSSAAMTNAVCLVNINSLIASKVSIATFGKHLSRSSINTTNFSIEVAFNKSSKFFETL